MTPEPRDTELDNSPTDLEIQRVARRVGVPPADLADLSVLPPEDLRALREQIAAKLFDEGADSWDRVVAVTRVVPTGLAARLAQGALGPVLTARVTSRVDVDRATNISAKLPAEFLADTAIAIDPRQVTDLVVKLPPETIAEVGAVLARRREWLVMADFVAAVTEPALQRTVDILDEASLLRTAVLLEDPARVTTLVGMISDQRLAHVRDEAARQGLDAHLNWVAETVDVTQRQRLINLP